MELEEMMGYLGKQIIAELFECETGRLNSLSTVKKAMLEAARASNSTVVRSVFHKFNPQGISGVVVVAESHLAIHTWPEYGYAAVDIFTCGERTKPEEGLKVLAKLLGAKRVKFKKIKRGLLSEIEDDSRKLLLNANK
ncbi:MAG: adenosylmethionine decarboxylase [Thermoproteota archaeon]|jgi:S-adenosylmethionine decarboxylase proenzyme